MSPQLPGHDGGTLDGPAPSVHPPGARPDQLALAEFDIGLPDEAGRALASAHIDGCADCQQVLSGLRATSAEVGRLAGTPMPAAVADRIATALSVAALSQPALSSDAPSPDAPSPDALSPDALSPDAQRRQAAEADSGRHRAAQVIEMRSARRVRRLRVAAGLAAGVVLLGGGGYLLVDATDGQRASTTSADSGAGAAAPEVNGEGGSQSGAESQALPEYDRASLEAAVDELLASGALSPAGGSRPPPAAPEQDAGGAEVDPGCLATIPLVTAEALSVTRVLYEGVPAIVVIFPSEPGRVQVTVFSDCAESAVPAVLDEFTAAR